MTSLGRRNSASPLKPAIDRFVVFMTDLLKEAQSGREISNLAALYEKGRTEVVWLGYRGDADRFDSQKKITKGPLSAFLFGIGF